MAQDQQLERLNKLRAARQTNAVRLEPNKNNQQVTAQQYFAPQAAQERSRRNGHGRAFGALLFLAAIALILLGGIFYVSHSFQSSVGGPKRVVRFVVKPGESVGAIASDLKQQGLVSSSLLFQLYYRVNGNAQSIQVGPHALNTAMTMDQIAHALQVAPPTPVYVAPSFQCCTFLAGKRSEEIAHLLDKYGVASYDSVMYEIRHGVFHYWFLKGRPAGSTLDGFLLPGYYPVTKHYNAHRLINRMLAAFNRYFTPSMHAEAARAHRSVYQIVEIAAIVQRESALPKVQRYIAGVYYNRLDPQNVNETNGLLAADPTVQYALGYRADEGVWWERHLTQDMIKQVQNSPYNTYYHQGLPPSPISNPGQTAIQAALRPAKSPYLYFQVLPKGKTLHTYFCRTLQCQTSNSGVIVN